LNINGMDILEWFEVMYREVQQKIEMKVKPDIQRNRGIKR